MRSIIVLAVMCSFAVLAGCSGTELAGNNAPANNTMLIATPSPAATVNRAALGKELYAENCMICHKEDGTGGPVTVNGKKLNPEDLTSKSLQAHSDEELIAYVRDGVEDEGMPAFKDKLGEDEIQAVVAHVRSLPAR